MNNSSLKGLQIELNGSIRSSYHPLVGPASSWRLPVTHTPHRALLVRSRRPRRRRWRRQRRRAARPCSSRRRPSVTRRTSPCAARAGGGDGAQPRRRTRCSRCHWPCQGEEDCGQEQEKCECEGMQQEKGIFARGFRVIDAKETHLRSLPFRAVDGLPQDP